MTLDFLHIPISILKLPDVNLREKLLLGLVISFNEKGLRMSNDSLGEILDIWPTRVSRLLKNLKQKGYVKIENPQNRYRTIYLLQSAKVDGILPSTKRNSRSILPSTLSTSTIAQSSTIIKVTKEEETSSAQTTFVELWNSQKTLPEIKAFTSQRKVHFQARMREPLFAENWREIIGKLSGSSFCTGKNDRGWLADVDWVLKNATNYTKVLEGKYEDKQADAGKTTKQDGYEGYHGDVIGNDGNVITHAFSDEEIENLRVAGVHI